MNTNNKLYKPKSIDETERMIDRMIDKFNLIDEGDEKAYKLNGFTLQLIDRAIKLSDTKLRYEALRQKISSYELVDEPKKLKQS